MKLAIQEMGEMKTIPCFGKALLKSLIGVDD